MNKLFSQCAKKADGKKTAEKRPWKKNRGKKAVEKRPNGNNSIQPKQATRSPQL